MSTKKIDVGILKRFIRYVRFNETTHCWEWTGATSNGYAQFQMFDQRMIASRISWALFVEDVPPDLDVLHVCDNPKCVNPDHLFLGTQQDNADDMVRKERQARGSRHGMSLLNEESVKAIRSKFKPRVCTMRMLAREYKVSLATISDIIRWKTWRHLK